MGGAGWFFEIWLLHRKSQPNASPLVRQTERKSKLVGKGATEEAEWAYGLPFVKKNPILIMSQIKTISKNFITILNFSEPWADIMILILLGSVRFLFPATPTCNHFISTGYMWHLSEPVVPDSQIYPDNFSDFRLWFHVFRQPENLHWAICNPALKEPLSGVNEQDETPSKPVALSVSVFSGWEEITSVNHVLFNLTKFTWWKLQETDSCRVQE